MGDFIFVDTGSVDNVLRIGYEDDDEDMRYFLPHELDRVRQWLVDDAPFDLTIRTLADTLAREVEKILKKAEQVSELHTHVENCLRVVDEHTIVP